MNLKSNVVAWLLFCMADRLSREANERARSLQAEAVKVRAQAEWIGEWGARMASWRDKFRSDLAAELPWMVPEEVPIRPFGCRGACGTEFGCGPRVEEVEGGGAAPQARPLRPVPVIRGPFR